MKHPQWIPAHWSRPFNNKIFTYMIRREKFALDDVYVRFNKQARRVYAS